MRTTRPINPPSTRIRVVTPAWFPVWLLCAVAWAGSASAVTINVETTTDELVANSVCSLREAIFSGVGATDYPECELGSGAGADVIQLAASTYTITITGTDDTAVAGDLDVDGTLTIQGPTGQVATIVAATGDRAIHVISGTITLERLVIDGGSGVDGAGVQVNSGASFSAVDTRFQGGDGRAAANCPASSPPGLGGAILTAGTVTLTRCLIDSNTAGAGGAIAATAGTVTIANSTITANTGDTGGGCPPPVAGILAQGGADIVLNNVTLAGNSNDTADPDGLVASGAGSTIIYRNSVISDACAAPSSGSITSNNFNAASGTGCPVGGANDTTTAATLGALGNNGGLTSTMLPALGSNVIGTGNCTDSASNPVTEDQTALFTRTSPCDIGAFETRCPNDAGCNDSDSCTTDTCNRATGCTNSTAASRCTSNGTCAASVCTCNAGRFGSRCEHTVLVSAAATATAGANWVVSPAVTNAGSVASTTSTVKLTVPSGTTFASGTGCSESANIVTCTLGSIAAGATTSVGVSFLVDPSAVIGAGLTTTISTTSFGEATGGITTTASTTVVRSSDLDLTVTAPANVNAGATLIYTVAVNNNGPSTSAGTEVSIPVPAGTTYSTSSVTCSGGSTRTCALGTIALGGTSTFTIEFLVPATVGTGTVLASTLSVSSTSDESIPSNNTKSASTSVTRASNLAISASAPANVTAGGSLSYTVSVSNAGPSSASTTVVSVPIPSGTTYASSTVACTGSGPLSCALGSLDVSGSAGFTITFNVGASAAAGANLTSTLTASSASTDGTPGNNTAALSSSVVRSSDLSSLTSSAPTSATAGANWLVTLQVQNLGPSDAASAFVETTIPSGLTYVDASSTAICADTGGGKVKCDVTGAFTPGSTSNFTVAFAVPASASSGTAFATTTGVGSASSDGTASNNATTLNGTSARASDLSVSASTGPASVTAGNTLTYGIVAANAGPSNASNVVVEVTYPANATFVPGSSDAACGDLLTKVQCSFSSINAGANRSFNVVFTSNPSSTAGTPLGSTVTVSSASPDPTPGNDTKVFSTDVTRSSDLAGNTASAPATVPAGSNWMVTLPLSNVGPSDAASAFIETTIPSGTTFVPASSSGACTPVSSKIRCAAGTLTAGSSTSMAVAFAVANTALSGAVLAAVVTTGSDSPDAVATNNGITVNGTVTRFDLNLTAMTANPTSATPGATVAYTINYTNEGSAGATGVTISETVPPNTRFDVATSSPTVWSCADQSTAGTSCTTTVGTVNAGGFGNVRFGVRVVNPVPAGTTSIANTATIASVGGVGIDADPVDDTRSLSINVTAAPIVTASFVDTHHVDVDSDGLVEPGDTLRYTLTVANTGNTDASAVVFAGSIPANTSYVASSLKVNGSAAPGTVSSVTIGTVAGSASATVTFDVTVNSPLAAGVAAVTATGVVQGSNFTQLSTDDPSTVAAADATVTPVDAAPNLAVTKTTSSTNLSPGGTATFNLGTSNAGNQAATGVILTETVPPGATYDSAASAPSVWSCANGSVAGTSCTLSIGAMAVGAGPSHKFVVKVVNPLTSALTAVANTVAISDDLANGADPVTSNNTASASASIASLPDAFVSVTSTTTEAATGATISYAVSYGNKGTANITSQTVTLTVPPKTTFLPDQSSTLWSCPGAGLGGTTCSFSGAQTAGTNASAPFVVKVDDILTATDTAISLVLSTTIAGSPAQLDATNDATTLVIPVRQAPDLQVTATAGSPTVVAGQTLVYTASWKNIGTRTSTGVVLSATVPASATYVVGGDTPAWTCPNGGVAGSVCTLSLGDIPTVTANASAGQGTRTFTVVVAASVPESFSGVTSTLSITDAGVNPSELNTTNNQAEVTTPVKAAPDLALTAVASGGSVTVGTLQVYTFTYRNLGNALSKGVEVTVNVPNNATSNAAAVSPTTWSCPDGSAAGTPCVFDVGDLAAGATGTVDFAVTVDSTLPRTVSNVVMTADLQDDPGDPANVPEIVTSNNGASITTPVDKLPDLKVTMSATVQGGGAVQPGSIITYTLNYSNVGNQTAFVPVLTQTIPVYTTFTPDGPTSFVCSQGTGGGKSCTLSLPNLAPFASGSATFRVTVDAALPAQATEIVSTASIAGSGNDLNFTDNTASVTSSIGTAPDPALISLSHNAPGAGVKPNDPIIYTITYNNLGSATATTVHLAVTVPAETSFRSTGSTAGWSCNPAAGQAGSVCRLSVGPITSNKAPTPTATFALLVDPEVAADVTQIPLTAAIEITGTGELSTANNSQSATVNVAALPDLIISDIDDGDVTVGLGDTLTYAITYENVGRLNASGVSLRETVPVGTSFLAASSTQGWNCTPAAGLAGAVCTFTVGALAINTPSSVLFAVKVNSTLTKNEANLTNTAQVLAGGSQAELSTANNTLTELTPVEPGPEIVVTKIADSTVVTTNQTVKYTLTIENRGTADATGVVVTERVPANTTFVEGVDVNQDSSAPIVWGCATVAGGTPCPLTIGSLPKNGAPLKLTFTVKVNASLNQVAKITNQVSIADDNAHGDELDASNDSFTHEVQVGGAPDLSVSAVATPANVVAGSLVNLDFSYRNAGSEPANSVTLAVTLPPKVARNPLVGDTNWICVVQTGGGFNCTLALGSVGAGVGPITKRLGLKLASAFTATDLELVMPSSITINDPGIIDLNPPDNAASTTLSVLAGPLMTLQKTTTTVQAKVNEPIIYTL
ncbi:MAG: DUF11 domain-containing protein, partial [Myxococcales bacterium]|nr:DUF11 domain-containing protein [Myxococcales bacterium]